MAKITYHIVEHDGGWAYRVDGVFSETFPSPRRGPQPRSAPLRSSTCRAKPAAISWEDKNGKWHEELARGDDRPETDVEG